GSFLLNDIRFALQGVETEADVVDCEYQDAIGRNLPTLALTYRYSVFNPEVGQSQRHTGTENVPARLSCLEVPDTLQIRYLGVPPSQARLVDDRVIPTQSERIAVQVIVGAVTLMLALGVLFFINSIFKYRRAQACLPRLQQNGIVLKGEIV